MADLNRQDDMKTLMAILALFVRLFRPSRGWHTTYDTYLGALRTEFSVGRARRARRARRVRRYVESIPVLGEVVA